MGRYQQAAPHFQEWAEGLVQSAEPLSHVAIDELLFIEDTETETKSDAKKYMELKRIPEFVEDALGAHHGVTRKAYAVIIYRLNCANLDNETMIAHLAEQLLKIPAEGRGLEKPDIITFEPLAKALGYNWKQRLQEKLPNLLTDRPKGWPARQVQASLELAPKAPPGPDGIPPETVAALTQQGITDDTLSSPLVQEAVQEAAAVKATKEAESDDWQPEQPYATKDNVIPMRRPTGTDGPDVPSA